MTLEAKVTAFQADASQDTATVSLQMYDTAAPATILWSGDVPVRLDWPPERLLDKLDEVFDRLDARRQAIARLQNLVGKTQRRRTP